MHFSLYMHGRIQSGLYILSAVGTGLTAQFRHGAAFVFFIHSFSAVHPAQRASFWAFVSFLSAISRRRAADLSAHASR